jgi:2-polyprenyl-3-methyl-5-hydroxy-6-metoxy-1,4-benzoquinol methylase
LKIIQKLNKKMNTTWIEKLMSGEGSKHSNLREHILSVHKSNPGFTENCAQSFKNKAGKSSYQWLAEIIQPKIHHEILDLACGSGPLLEICDEMFGKNISLTGLDMSDEELALAKTRL